jgi:superfamily I DNA and/or RNA helicase
MNLITTLKTFFTKEKIDMANKFFRTLLKNIFGTVIPAVSLAEENPISIGAVFTKQTMENETDNTIHKENMMTSDNLISAQVIPTGDIYLDFARYADDFTDNKSGRVYYGLRTQLEKLRQKLGNTLFPSMQDGDDIVEFFRDVFFPNERPQNMLISNLTIGSNPKAVNLLIRPAVVLPSQEMELPRGLSLALRVNYQIETFDKRTQSGRVNTAPLLRVQSIANMPHCEKRDFENELAATVYSAYSFNDYIQKRNGVSFFQNNAVSLDFVEKLPQISQQTERNLKEWNDYLNFWERYTISQIDGLRFVKAEFANGVYRFLVIAKSQEEFYKHSKFLQNDDVLVYTAEHSTDAWTFKLNEEERYPKSFELGDYERPSGKQQPQSVSLPDELQKELGAEKTYCTWISFKLSEEQQEKYESRLAKEEKNKLDTEFMQKIPQSGWLSLSASGDFALINRLRNQLKTLQEQGGYAPFLSSYLFDIKKARQPKMLAEITDWMNPNMNEDQKNAVRKMLSVPDIGLMQGPPGTGKTTVIAELIYQFVKQGKTVGVFSQANLAVDNALERLASNPIIRAVRLGRKADSECPYHQDNVLGTFYKAVADNCRKNTVDNWTDWERQITELTDWLNSTEFLYQDVVRLNEARNNAETDYDHQEVSKAFSEKRTQLFGLMQSINREMTKISEYPQLREAVEKQLQNAKEQYSNVRPIKDAWSDILAEFTADLAKAGDKKSYINDEYLRNCNVAGVSCTENARTLLDAGYAHFDVVIIDEVSKASPPELIMPMLLGKTAILVGDHRQLPPVFKQKGANFDLEQSFEEILADNDETETKDNVLTEDNLKRFEKMVSASWFKEQFEKAPETLKVSLWTQYRMHPDIMRCINQFYEGRLTCGLRNPNDERQHSLILTGERRRTLLNPEQHVLWVDSGTLSSGQPNYEENTGAGKVNKLEAALIAKMLMQLETEYRKQGFTVANPKQVAVITFYSKQLREIRKAIRRAGNFTAIKVNVNTVDKFQGQERPIVFVSMVRCPRGKLSRIANTASFERINVAFSRAQELLVIFGSAKTFNSYPVELPNLNNTGKQSVNVYKNIIDEIDRNAGLHTARDILSVSDYKSFMGIGNTPKGYTSRPVFNFTTT